MKIREVLELSQQKTIAQIAKEELTIGEKLARQALREAGCFSVVGQPGWNFDKTYNAENLDKSIYKFADLVKQNHSEELRQAANVETFQQNSIMVPRKRHSFDLDVRLMKQLKLKCVQEDLTLYEAVENAIRLYLKEDETL